MFKSGLIGSYRAQKLASLLLGCALGVLVLLAGLGSPGQPRCSFGRDHVVAASRGKRIDAVALAGSGTEPVAFWSDIDGLFARRLDPSGKPSGPAVRLAPRCSGGIDALAGDSGFTLACLRRPAWESAASQATASDDAASDAAAGGAYGAEGVSVYSLNHDLALDGSVHFPGAGTMSDGVSLASRSGRTSVAWHDGSPDRQQVWLAEISRRQTAPPRVISDPLHLAGVPGIARGDSGWIVWAETWMEGEQLRGQITLHDGKGAPHGLLPVSYAKADPRIVALGGRLLLAFRQRGKSGGRAGFYFAWMSADGRVLGEPVRVARADADARPAIGSCLGGMVVAAPRTYGASLFIGVNLIDLSFNKKGGEQHFYDVSREIYLAASYCAGDGSLLLMAEQGASAQEQTRVRSVAFGCD